MPEVTIEQLAPEIQVIKLSGKYDYTDIISTIQLHGGEIRHHLVWDFSNAVVNLNIGELQDLMPVIRSYSSSRQTESKTALVASREYSATVMDLYASFGRQAGLPYQYRCFDTMEHAMEWLQEEAGGTGTSPA